MFLVLNRVMMDSKCWVMEELWLGVVAGGPVGSYEPRGLPGYPTPLFYPAM